MPSQDVDQWINGGYFVIEPIALNYIKNDNTVFERVPLKSISRAGQLVAYKHSKFWQCVDTKRDKDYLENLWNKNKKFW